MKKTFLIILFAFCLALAAPVSFAQKETVKPSKRSSLNIVELTNSQTYRYGREMYLSRRYTEAVRVFAEILRKDCNNKLAHYHLQKIADEAPGFAYLKQQLKEFPCKSPDFIKEDFLPTSLYYEKDVDILFDQLLAYQKRQRLSEEELNATIERYTAMVNKLEAAIAAGGDQELNEAAISHLEDGRQMASRIEKEISLVTSRLASERLERQKEVQDMRTRVAEAEVSLASTSTSEHKTYTENSKAYSPSAQKLIEAVAKAKEQLAGQERSLSEKDRSLATLQERFDNIQQRLRLIQNDISGKNIQIEELHTNIQDIKKP